MLYRQTRPFDAKSSQALLDFKSFTTLFNLLRIKSPSKVYHMVPYYNLNNSIIGYPFICCSIYLIKYEVILMLRGWYKKNS